MVRLRPHTTQPSGNRSESVLQRAGVRDPELVGVSVDDPVGAVLGPCKPGHPCVARPALVHLSRLPPGMRSSCPVALIRVEDLRRPVARVMIRDDHEVDTGVQVVRDLCVDDVDLVADNERLRRASPPATSGSSPSGFDRGSEHASPAYRRPALKTHELRLVERSGVECVSV